LVVKYAMQKTYFHDRKHNSEKKVQKKDIPLQYIDQKRIVDINKLLNRVRIDKKNDIKRKAIFYCSTILALSFFSVFIMVIK
jgi:hypothetical protein